MRLAPMNIEQVLIGRDVEGSEDIINYMDEQGLTSAPLVRIYRDDELVAEWTNFNIKEINKWRTKAVEENAKD